MEDGHADHDPRGPVLPEIIAETVVHIGVAHQIVGRQGNCGKHIGTGDVGLFVVDLAGKVEPFRLRTGRPDILHGLELLFFRQRNRVEGFVRKGEAGIQRNSYLLAKQHPCEHEAVRSLGQRHVGLICTDPDRKGIRLGGDPFPDGDIHIALHLMEKFGVAFGELFLVGHRDHLPVGLVYVYQHFIVIAVVFVAGQVLGIFRHLVGCDYLSAHE